jgi:hypothetical protein
LEAEPEQVLARGAETGVALEGSFEIGTGRLLLAEEEQRDTAVLQVSRLLRGKGKGPAEGGERLSGVAGLQPHSPLFGCHLG